MNLKPKETVVDVAVIGGGIAGAAIARDAALRGLRVILFEKNTAGSGTSGASSKLIHGGIRYLEFAWDLLKRWKLREAWKNMRFVFFSLRESRILERIAPDLVSPVALLIPLYRGAARSRWSVYAGVLAYFVLARLTGPARFPRMMGTRASVLKEVPSLEPHGLLGGVVYWDRRTDDQKLVRATLESARRCGVEAHENARVTAYRPETGRGGFRLDVRIRDGDEVFYAKKLVNATGPWVDQTRRLGGEEGNTLVTPLAGCHIGVKRFVPVSLLLEAEDGRRFFVINTGETSRIGTTERANADPDHVHATAEEIDYLLRSVRRYFPGIGLTRNDIRQSDAGIRPLAASDPAIPGSAISREHVVTRAPSGALHVVGVKLTDHRRAAAEVVDRLVRELRRDNPTLSRKSLTHKRPLEAAS